MIHLDPFAKKEPKNPKTGKDCSFLRGEAPLIPQSVQQGNRGEGTKGTPAHLIGSNDKVTAQRKRTKEWT